MNPQALQKRFLAPLTSVSYTALRFITGAMFALHGAQKLFGVLGASKAALGTQIWIGAVIELVAGTAIALGLYASWAAFLASGQMAVAYIQFHWKLRFDNNFFPVVNKGELALVYCFLFLYIACRGGGAWSTAGARR